MPAHRAGFYAGAINGRYYAGDRRRGQRLAGAHGLTVSATFRKSHWIALLAQGA